SLHGTVRIAPTPQLPRSWRGASDLQVLAPAASSSAIMDCSLAIRALSLALCPLANIEPASPAMIASRSRVSALSSPPKATMVWFGISTAYSLHLSPAYQQGRCRSPSNDAVSPLLPPRRPPDCRHTDAR